MRKRFLTVLLALCLAVNLLPVSTLAADAEADALAAEDGADGQMEGTMSDSLGEDSMLDGLAEDAQGEASGYDIQIGEDESAGEAQEDDTLPKEDEEATVPAGDGVLPEEKGDAQAPLERDIASGEEDIQIPPEDILPGEEDKSVPQEDGTPTDEAGDAESQKAEPVAYANTVSSGTCGENLTWTLDDDGVLTISGIGDMDLPIGEPGPWYTYEDDIKIVIIKEGVTSVGDHAFDGCGNLVSVTIPDSVTLIDRYAFCLCTGLTGITIPENVTNISDHAFHGCSSLTSIKIPDNVTIIGTHAFAACTSLTSITIPNSVTIIGMYAFQGCSNLTSIKVPDGITYIESGVFGGCIKLASITIPNSITTIYDYAFSFCSSLKDVYYGGSRDEWQLISIESNNEYLTNASIHYNSTGPDNEEPGDTPVKPPVTPPPAQSGTDTSIRLRNIVFYSPIGNRVFGLDMDWGWDLFLKSSSTGYDYRLAKIGLALSGASERSQEAVEDMLVDGGSQYDDSSRKKVEGLGFDSEMVVSQNYGRKWYESGYPAVTFGHKSITLKNGEKSHIIAIVLRGTQAELGDISVDAYSIFGAFTWSADNTYKMLQTYITNCSMNTGEVSKDNVKFFITGHSLGGAVSNILAQKLNDEYGAENVFAYTFATPRSTLFSYSSHNIYNILNAEDQVPVSLSTQLTRYGDDIWFSRFEYEPAMYDRFREITGGKDLQAVMKSWNHFNDIPFVGNRFLYGHAVETYMSYLLARGGNGNKPVNYFRLAFRCPVDVEIYVDDGTEEGLLVGRVTDNVVDDTVTPGVYIEVEGDEKYVYLMYEGDYRIKLTGTDNGTMEYSVQEMELNSGNVIESKTFENVLLTDGKEMTSAISVWNKNDDAADDGSKIDAPEVQLFVLDSEGVPEKEVLPDGNGTEVPIASPGATYSVTFDANGGSVETTSMDTGADGRLSNLPTPIRSGYVFKGWYTATEGGEQVGANTVFDRDTTVYAQWAQADGDRNDASEEPPAGGNGSETPKEPENGNGIKIPERPGAGNSNGTSGDSGSRNETEASEETNAEGSRTILSPETGEEGMASGIVEILGSIFMIGIAMAVIGSAGRGKEKQI